MQAKWITRLCALTLGAALLAPKAARAAGYALNPEDILTVSVYGHDDLAREVVVLDDGHFNYPIVGRVDAGGKTPEQVAAAITQGLKSELSAPQVTVSVKQPAMRRVYVSGLVEHTGSFNMLPGWRVSHLIAEAGGLTAKPELAKAVLTRGDETIPVDLSAMLTESSRDADVTLQPGDLLQIQPDTNLVHIVGQVRTPGDYQMRKGLGVLEAMAMAGGGLENAALTRAQIIRDGQVVKVDARALLNGDADTNITLKPGDTLVVPANEARIAVLGGVQGPGYFDLPDGKAVTLVDALAMAHGANKRAKIDRVAVVRIVDGKQVVSKVDVSRFLKQGDASQNPNVLPGDVVYVTDGGNIEPNTLFAAALTLVNPLAGAVSSTLIHR